MAAGAGTPVYSSSVGAYSPATGPDPVDEVVLDRRQRRGVIGHPDDATASQDQTDAQGHRLPRAGRLTSPPGAGAAGRVSRTTP
jgi:hypothetical protein